MIPQKNKKPRLISNEVRETFKRLPFKYLSFQAVKRLMLPLLDRLMSTFTPSCQVPPKHNLIQFWSPMLVWVSTRVYSLYMTSSYCLLDLDLVWLSYKKEYGIWCLPQTSFGRLDLTEFGAGIVCRAAQTLASLCRFIWGTSCLIWA